MSTSELIKHGRRWAETLRHGATGWPMFLSGDTGPNLLDAMADTIEELSEEAEFWESRYNDLLESIGGVSPR